MSLLEIDSVNFSYGSNRILSDIYLKVNSGEVVGFLGRNGCGKSTLLKIIFGVLKGDSQSIRIDGKYTGQAFHTNQVKFIPQEGLFPGFLTPKKAISLYRSDLDRLLTYEELASNFIVRFDQMSGGTSKYLETLIVLHSPCSFVLLDEPFSYISPVLVEKLIPTLKLISKRKGILLTDHQYESILTVSDRLYLLRDGSLSLIGGREDLIDMGYIRG